MQTVSASFAEIVIQGIGEWIIMSALAALLGAFCSRLNDISGQKGAVKLHAAIACIGVALMLMVKPVSDTQAGVYFVLFAFCLLLILLTRFATPRMSILQQFLRNHGGGNFSAGAALFAGVACGSGEMSAILIMVLAIAFASVWRTAPYTAPYTEQTTRQQTALKVQAAPKCTAPKYNVLMASVQQAPVAIAPQSAPQAAPHVSAVTNVVTLDLPPAIVHVTAIMRQEDNEAPVQLAFNFAA